MHSFLNPGLDVDGVMDESNDDDAVQEHAVESGEQGSDDSNDGDDDAIGSTEEVKGGTVSSTPCSFTSYDDQYISMQDTHHGNQPTERYLIPVSTAHKYPTL